jgi:ankyrin repeat protein
MKKMYIILGIVVLLSILVWLGTKGVNKNTGSISDNKNVSSSGFVDPEYGGIQAEKVFATHEVISLAKAVSSGDLQEVQRLIETGVNVKEKGEKGFTMTHFALYAKKNGPQILESLLKAGADPISVLENGEDVPHYAASRDSADPEFLEVLLNNGVSANLIGGTEKNSLLNAAVSGRNIPVVLLLLRHKPNINYNHPFVGTALHTAIVIPDYKIATILLENGADPKLKNNTDPSISSTVPKHTPAEKYCKFISGKRTETNPERLSEFEEMKKAFAKQSVVFPCGI